MDIKVYDTNFVLVDIIDIFNSIIWVDKYDDVGTFELYLRATDRNLSLIQKDYYLSIKESDHMMIVDSIEIKSDVEDGDIIVVQGQSLASILDRRIIWEQTNLVTTFLSAIEQLLNENAISPSDSARQISNLIYSTPYDYDLVTMPDVDEQYYGENLLEVIRDLCIDRDVGFKIILNDSHQFVFSLYYGEDRSFEQTDNSQIIFSPKLDNLISSDYVESNVGSATVTLVIGEGEGINQKIRTVALPSGPGTGINRREILTDANDISYTIEGGTLTDEEYQNKLQGRGERILALMQPLSQFSAKVDDKPSSFKYGQDFFLGDIVQAVNEYGLAGPMRISEFVISEDIDGYKIYPTFKMI